MMRVSEAVRRDAVRRVEELLGGGTVTLTQ